MDNKKSSPNQLCKCDHCEAVIQKRGMLNHLRYKHGILVDPLQKSAEIRHEKVCQRSNSSTLKIVCDIKDSLARLVFKNLITKAISLILILAYGSSLIAYTKKVYFVSEDIALTIFDSVPFLFGYVRLGYEKVQKKVKPETYYLGAGDSCILCTEQSDSSKCQPKDACEQMKPVKPLYRLKEDLSGCQQCLGPDCQLSETECSKQIKPFFKLDNVTKSCAQCNDDKTGCVSNDVCIQQLTDALTDFQYDIETNHCVHCKGQNCTTKTNCVKLEQKTHQFDQGLNQCVACKDEANVVCTSEYACKKQVQYCWRPQPKAYQQQFNCKDQNKAALLIMQDRPFDLPHVDAANVLNEKFDVPEGERPAANKCYQSHLQTLDVVNAKQALLHCFHTKVQLIADGWCYYLC